MAKALSPVIVALVFAILFALLYASSYIQAEAKRLYFEELQVKKTDVTISRFQDPVNVCFTLSEPDLARYGFLSYFIDEADRIAKDDQPNDDGRYDGFGGGANTTEVVQFIGDYEPLFNHTSVGLTIRGQYPDNVHTYSCNFEYDSKYYGIWFELRSLSYLSDHAGYVPITISENGVTVKLSSAIPQGPEQEIASSRSVTNPKDLTVFLSFNNTAVWANAIESKSQDSWVSLELSRLDDGNRSFAASTRIPPGQSWDFGLRPDYSANSTTYNFSVTLPSGTKHEGNIHIKYYPSCMSQAEAKSLYGQNGIDMRFPSHLPDNYRHICGTHNTGYSLIQSYWNGTEAEMRRVANETGYDSIEVYVTRDVGLQNGVIQIWSFKAERPEDPLWSTTAEDRRNDAAIPGQQNGQGTVIEIDPDNQVSAYALPWQLPGGNINVLEISDPSKGELYIIRAKLPMEEMVRVAQSMFI